MNQIVIIVRGISGAGKTTWSKDFVNKNASFMRVSRDDIDFMLREKGYTSIKEAIVFRTRNYLIQSILDEGFNLVLDETYLVPTRIAQINKELKKYVDQTGNHLDIKIKDFIDTPLSTCIERDRERHFHVGERFIRDYYRRYVIPLLENRGQTEWTI